MDTARAIDMLRYLSTSPVVVSAAAGAKRAAMLANTLALVSPSPFRISLSLRWETYTFHVISQARRFAVSFLDSVEAYAHLGSDSGWDKEKLPPAKCLTTSRLSLPAPKGVLAYLECELTTTFELDDRVLVVGTVEHGEVLRSGKPYVASIGLSGLLS